MTALLDPNPRAVIGGNQGPLWAEFRERLDGFVQGASTWAASGVASAEDAAGLNDFLAGARALQKEVDARRAELKRPHDQAAREVQEAFQTPLRLLDRVIAQAKAPLAAFLAAEQRRAEEARAEALEEARRQAEQAQARLRAAEATGGILDQFDAANDLAEAEEAAERAAKAPTRARAGSATGGARTASLRTTRRVEIANLSQAFMALRDEPEVAEGLLAAARRIVRAASYDGRPIAGVTITEEGTL